MSSAGLQGPRIEPEVAKPHETVLVELAFANHGPGALVGATLAFVCDDGARVCPGSLSINGTSGQGEQLAIPAVEEGGTVRARCALDILGSARDCVRVFVRISFVDGTYLESDVSHVMVQAVPVLTARAEASFSEDQVLVCSFTVRNDGGAVGSRVLVRSELIRDVGGPIAVITPVADVAPGTDTTLEVRIPLSDVAGCAVLALKESEVWCADEIAARIDRLMIEFPTSKADDVRLELRPVGGTGIMHPGDVIEVEAFLRNSAIEPLADIPVTFRIPHEVTYIRESLRVNGRPVVGEADPNGEVRVSIQRVPACAIARASCMVAVRDTIDGEVGFEVRCGGRIVRGSLANRQIVEFAAEEVLIEGELPDELGRPRFAVLLSNTGTVAASAELRAQSSYVTWASEQGERAISLDAENGALEAIVRIGVLEPGERRRVIGCVEMAALYDDPHMAIGMVLHVAGLEPVPIGSYRMDGYGTALFGESAIVARCKDAWRFNQIRPLTFVLSNGGFEEARDVCVRLQLPDDIMVDEVLGALYVDGVLMYDHIPAGGVHGAVVRARFIGQPGGPEERTIGGLVEWNEGEQKLSPLSLRVFAEAYLTDACVELYPGLAGETIVRARVRNGGDGCAHAVRILCPDTSAYVANSTSCNGVTPDEQLATAAPVRDGLVIGDVEAGQWLSVEWRTRVPAIELLGLRVIFMVGDDQQRIEAAGALVTAGRPQLVSLDEGERAPVETMNVEEPPELPIPTDLPPWMIIESKEPDVEIDGGSFETSAAKPEAANSQPTTEPGDEQGAFATRAEVVEEAPRTTTFNDDPPDEKLAAFNAVVAELNSEPAQSAFQASPRSEIVLPASATPSIEVLLTTEWNEQRQQTLAVGLSQLSVAKQPGWARHLIALRLFLPSTVRCGSAGNAADETVEGFKDARRRWAGALRIPRLWMCFEDFVPSEGWFSQCGDAAVAQTLHLAYSRATSVILEGVADEEQEVYRATVSLSSGKSIGWWYAALPQLCIAPQTNEPYARATRDYLASAREFLGAFETVSDEDVMEQVTGANNAALDIAMGDIVDALKERVAG